MKRLLQNLGLSIGSILLVLVVLELVLTGLGYGNLVIYAHDDTLFWRPLPNQHCYTKIGHQPVTINSHGTRGDEFEIDRPAGVFRVLCLGDSRTFGWGLSDSETYPAKLQALLQDFAGDSPRVEVINSGVNGWSWPQVSAYFRDIGSTYSPDVVVVADAYAYTLFHDGATDAFRRKMKWRIRLKNLLRRSAVYHYFFEFKFREIYFLVTRALLPERAEEAEEAPRKTGMGEYDFYHKHIFALCEAIDARGFVCKLMYMPVEDEKPGAQRRSSYWEIKQEASRRYGMELIDMTPDFAASPDKLFLERDPLHQNAEGNAIIARKLLEAIKPDLETWQLTGSERR